MKRSLLILLTTVSILAGAATASGHKIIPHVSSCANSYPNDGHVGPYHTPDNGGTLHGNTVHIDCPNPNVHWDVTYTVQLLSNGVWRAELGPIHRSGNGSPLDWSVTRSPDSCSQGIYAFPFRTHVVNNVTGGTINKPGGGSGAILCQ